MKRKKKKKRKKEEKEFIDSIPHRLNEQRSETRK